MTNDLIRIVAGLTGVGRMSLISELRRAPGTPVVGYDRPLEFMFEEVPS